MCGICGFTGNIERKDSIIEDMTNVILHRGPSDLGFFSDDAIAIGFRRLSIVDSGGGKQPIYNENQNLVLTFNGEIYNFKELRAELLEKGHEFYTQTDSEVIIHGFEEWGEKVVERLRGMFAFVIWNRTTKELFLARDHFGIKPLHWAQCNESFVYASEIKSILKMPNFAKKLNLKALDHYLSFQYCPQPITFFEGVYCLIPGHFMWHKNGEVSITRYFTPVLEPDEALTMEDATTQIETALKDSIEVHKSEEFDFGCFLSSGVDSSFIAAHFPGKKAFTVGFGTDEKYNEISSAANFAKQAKLEHITRVVPAQEFWAAAPKVQYFMDQPLADPSAIALYFVSKLASEHVRVVLSGEGADELFGGYRIYTAPKATNFYQQILPQSIRTALANFAQKIPFKFKGRGYILRGENPKIEDKYIGNAMIFDEKDKQKLLKPPAVATKPQDFCRLTYKDVREYGDVEKMQFLDMHLWLVGDILHKADRMSMANSIELRVPFLDKEVFKVARKLSERLKIFKGNTKIALRAVAEKKLPHSVAQKPKLGFPVPIRVWLKQDAYYGCVKAAFESERAEGFFCKNEILRLLEDHKAGRWDNSRKIWTVYSFLLWHEQYFPENGKA